MMHTNKNARRWVLAASGFIAAVMSAPAIAQEVTATADPVADEEVETVIVKGLRKSLQSAVNKKRRAAQIVDAIDAEDAGKLPDNNVTEAIARITGVQITRERGEGGSVAIRGMTDVQTTLNGSPNNTGVGRSASLNDIPAELLKSVQVYKTRTADQVEGGIAGTVNVDLRRPLDLPMGWTVAGSVRNVYSSLGETESPYASGLFAKRWLTDAGEMGFLLNASYQENNYHEQWVTSETPYDFRWWPVQGAAVLPNAIAPYKVQNGVQWGKVRRPALNAAFQWKINEHLDILLEGSMMNAKESRGTDFLEARIKDTIGTLSNVVYMPDGRTIKSATSTDPDPTDMNMLPVGPYARDTMLDIENKRLNFEIHYNNDRLSANFSVYRDENRRDEDWYQQLLRIGNVAAVNFDFASDKMAEPGPYLEFLDASGNAVDLTDISNYYLREIENGKGYESSEETVFAGDVSYRLSDDKFLRRVQVGFRRSERDVERLYGYRYAGFEGARSVKLTDFPGGADYDTIQADVPGYQSPSWYRMSRASYLGNFDAIRAYASDPTKMSYGGGGMWDAETGPVPGYEQWSYDEVQTERMMGTFNSNEKTMALFGQFFYGFNIGSVLVDGVAGVRVTRTTGDSFAYARRINRVPNPAYDPVTNPNVPEFIEGTPPQLMVPLPIEGKYMDVLPSINGIIHFTPKLQLRLAYTENTQRPDFQQASSFLFYDRGTSGSGIGSGWGGNPDLKANNEKSYDASLEYYFGRGGIVSFATYLKKADGYIYDRTDLETIDGAQYNISRPHNTGPGRFQGYEFNAQGFFEFLPGFWSNFGGQANATYLQDAEINYGPGIDTNAIGMSKTTYNLALYYDTPQFSARVAYNYRDRYRAWADAVFPEYSPYIDETSRLDAAVNWTPIKQLTLSVEGTNLLENNTVMSWGRDNLLPQGMRVQARTVQLSARFRY